MQGANLLGTEVVQAVQTEGEGAGSDGLRRGAALLDASVALLLRRLCEGNVRLAVEESPWRQWEGLAELPKVRGGRARELEVHSLEGRVRCAG